MVVCFIGSSHAVVAWCVLCLVVVFSRIKFYRSCQRACCFSMRRLVSRRVVVEVGVWSSALFFRADECQEVWKVLGWAGTHSTAHRLSDKITIRSYRN